MGNQKITPTNFVATVYGNLTPLNNSAFSKARLKIFYKGLNRNGSYITDEVAEKLLSTLPGTPIVGSFSGEKDDFEGHMPWSPEELKAYGFVPQDMNFSWEMSLDPDGVYRTYACTDIILWTGRYPVASRIVGKSHSMELNPDTVEGEWIDDGDDYYYQFTNAEFFGLCILGNDYEPCFEGSSFYELHKEEEKVEFSEELQEMFSLYKRELDFADENQTGGQEMDKEEKDSVVEEEVVETPAAEDLDQEEEVPAEDEGKENKEEENKSEEEEENNEEETDSEEESEESEEEDEDENEEQEEESEEEEEEESEEEESDEQEGSEEPDLNSQLAEKDAEIAELRAQLEELNSYKAQKVHEEKEQVIETYSKKLSEEEVENFRSKIDEFESAIDLKKEIALCILDKEVEEVEESSNFSLVKNHKEELKDAEAIVARYAKK